MALQIPETFYVIKKVPVNREQKRKAQKEYEKIQKNCLPVLFAYKDEKEKTDDLREIAQREFRFRAKEANTGNVYVVADIDFFVKFFPTKEQFKQMIEPPKGSKTPAIIIALVIILIIIIAILNK